GEGWITFDPTPAAGLPTTRAEESPGFFGQLGNYLDTLRMTWRRWVLDYDFQRQLDLFGDDGESTSIADSLSALGRTLVAHWLGWMLLIVLWLAHTWWVRRAKRPLLWTAV